MLGIARTGDTVSGVCSASGHPVNTAFTGTWTSSHTSVHAEGRESYWLGTRGLLVAATLSGLLLDPLWYPTMGLTYTGLVTPST